jgi:adenosyl cobinamide kinase/adenosyl cobinamide phosphate guanylyltransferase
VIVLVLGGTRSGKSEVAERLAAELGGPVTYVATATPRDDEDFRRRVDAHRRRRPRDWTTIEAPRDLAAIVGAIEGTVIIDSLGAWIANADDFRVDATPLCRMLQDRPSSTVVVSEEVGLSVHPPTEVGRRFVDALGECNQAVSAIADRAVLVVAGRLLELGSPERAPKGGAVGRERGPSGPAAGDEGGADRRGGGAESRPVDKPPRAGIPDA